MSTRHTVKQGEHLLGIAASYGIGTYEVIWDHPENAEVKQLRQNPSVLLPGDVVFIPDPRPKQVSVATGQVHHFRVRRPKALLRLKLLDSFGQPLPATHCVLEVEGARHEIETDGDGVLEQEVPATAQAAKLSVDDIELDIHIGHLDPVDTPTGLQARLNNLGYYVGDVNEEGVDPEQLRFALELFQHDNDLEVDGEQSKTVLDKVKEVHGC